MKSILVLGSLALGVLGASELLGAERAPEDAGRRHVQATCVRCHPGPQLDVAVARRLDPQNRATFDAFDAFLATHHVPAPDLRAEVIAYLEARLAGAPTGP